LVELGLSVATHKAAAAKAKAIAEAKIAPLLDPNLPEQERQKRKRRLLKGPSEFRDIRNDLPKTKPILPKTAAGRWKIEDDAVLAQLLEDGKELTEIALQMKRTLAAVRRRAADLRARGAFRTREGKAFFFDKKRGGEDCETEARPTVQRWCE
jgi:hypothetical protein